MTGTVFEPATAAAPAGPRQPAAFRADARVTFPRLLRAEWTKFTSLRSTVWTLLAATVVAIGLGVLLSFIIVGTWDNSSPQDRASFDATMISLTGTYLSQIAIGVLGALVITGEYSTGMIRTSVGAVPRRLPVLAAKATIFGVATFALTLVTTFIAFLSGQAILAEKNLGVSLSDPGVTRAVIGAAFFVTVIGLLGLAIGTMLRSTAGTIATLLGLIFVLPILTNLLPGDWGKIREYVPDGAGEALVTISRGTDVLSPVAGLLVLIVWLAAAFAGAAYVLNRRDA